MALYDPRPELAVFARAADEIEQRGLVKGVLEDACGRVCLIGALGYAEKALGPHWKFYEGIAPTLGFATLAEAVDWNNAPERTAGDVIGRLRRAAAGEWAP